MVQHFTFLLTLFALWPVDGKRKGRRAATRPAANRISSAQTIADDAEQSLHATGGGSLGLLRYAMWHKAEGGEEKSLIILMRSGGKKSPARVASVKSTWAKDLPVDRLVMFSEEERAFCKEHYGDNHGKGLTCLEALAEVRIANRTDWEWLLVVDDDTYVFWHHVAAKVSTLDPAAPKAYGIPGCGRCSGEKSFCGGGGYFISRQSLLKMMGATASPVTMQVKEVYLKEFEEEPEPDWCDVRFGCVARAHGLKLEKVEGLYGWRFKSASEEEHIAEMKKFDFPLVFHYISDDKHMQTVHKAAMRAFPKTT